MKTPDLDDHIEAFSFRAPTVKDERLLKSEIKEFLCAASTKPLADDVCPQCGQHLEYINIVFFLYGEDARWDIRLPLCQCTKAIESANAIGNPRASWQ